MHGLGARAQGGTALSRRRAAKLARLLAETWAHGQQMGAEGLKRPRGAGSKTSRGRTQSASPTAAQQCRHVAGDPTDFDGTSKHRAATRQHQHQ